MRISLFGTLRISLRGRPVTAVNTNRLHSLIAYLILHGDTPQPRERLAFMLWPGTVSISGAENRLSAGDKLAKGTAAPAFQPSDIAAALRLAGVT
jgi:hypothetical protein